MYMYYFNFRPNNILKKNIQKAQSAVYGFLNFKRWFSVSIYYVTQCSNRRISIITDQAVMLTLIEDC